MLDYFLNRISDSTFLWHKGNHRPIFVMFLATRTRTTFLYCFLLRVCDFSLFLFKDISCKLPCKCGIKFMIVIHTHLYVDCDVDNMLIFLPAWNNFLLLRCNPRLYLKPNTCPGKPVSCSTHGSSSGSHFESFPLQQKHTTWSSVSEYKKEKKIILSYFIFKTFWDRLQKRPYANRRNQNLPGLRDAASILLAKLRTY